MPKSKVPAADARAISRRLNELATTRYGTWYKFWNDMGIERTTAGAWVRNNPSVPEVPHLLRIARKANVSLDWLLLGEGPLLRERPADTPSGRVFAAIEAALRSTEQVTPREFDDAWREIGSSRKDGSAEEVAFEAAVDGVRSLFQGALNAVWFRRVLLARLGGPSSLTDDLTRDEVEAELRKMSDILLAHGRKTGDGYQFFYNISDLDAG